MIRRLPLVALCSLLPVSACDCGLEPLQTGRGSVAGTLCDEDTGKPVAGEIALQAQNADKTAQADDSGHYSFNDVLAGPASLTLPGGRSLDVTVNAGQTSTVVDPACREVGIEGYGNIAGRVCATDGQTYLSDAVVRVEVPGVSAFVDTTDADGNFLLQNVPAGTRTVVISKGSFLATREVEVPVDGTVTLAEDECAVEADHLRIAVVHGSQYDNVEAVLHSVGIQADVIDTYEDDWADLLLGPDEHLFDYDILFLSCRSAEPTYVASTAKQELLRRFVQQGGSVHASDQAYDLIEVTWPDAINFLGQDDVRGDADLGKPAELQARIVDDGLRAMMGHDTAQLAYRLSGWSIMAGVYDDNIHVFLEADVETTDNRTITDAPQIVGFSDGDGRVVYSSFHDEADMPLDQQTLLKLVLFEL